MESTGALQARRTEIMILSLSAGGIEWSMIRRSKFPARHKSKAIRNELAETTSNPAFSNTMRRVFSSNVSYEMESMRLGMTAPDEKPESLLARHLCGTTFTVLVAQVLPR